MNAAEVDYQEDRYTITDAGIAALEAFQQQHGQECLPLVGVAA